MELKLPDLSEKTKEAVITFWYAKEKDALVKGQDLLEIATDKATFDVTAPCDGVLVRIKKGIGDSIKKNEVIAEIKKNGK